MKVNSLTMQPQEKVEQEALWSLVYTLADWTVCFRAVL